MRYHYKYRAPDGAYDEGEIAAWSRDRAYDLLKTRGIRPMTVERMPLTALQRGGIALLCLAVTAAAVFHDDIRDFCRYGTGGRRQYALLVHAANVIRTAHREAFDHCDAAVFSACDKIEEASDVSDFAATLEGGRKLVADARTRTRDLFRNLNERFPESSSGGNALLDAQRLYGEMMNGFDADDERVTRSLLALKLLNDNRAVWSASDGKPVFTDAAIEKKFRSFRRGFDASTSQWQRDFGR